MECGVEKENNVIEFRERKNNQQNYNIQGSVVYERNIIKDGDKMDDLLKTYIEKVDRDQDSLKEDVRESEKRTHKVIEDSEKRMDARLDRIENLIEQQNGKLEGINKSVIDKMDENRKFMWGIVITILVSVGASIGVIVATYQSSISLIQQFIGK